MAQKTGKYTLNGTVLLSTALLAIGYKGMNALSLCSIHNPNDTSLYLWLDDQNTVPPVTPTDGRAIGNLEESTSFNFNGLSLDNFLDAGTCWLHSAAAIDIKISVIGTGA